MSTRMWVEKQVESALADPAWGIVLRLRPLQIGLLFGMRALRIEANQ